MRTTIDVDPKLFEVRITSGCEELQMTPESIEALQDVRRQRTHARDRERIHRQRRSFTHRKNDMNLVSIGVELGSGVVYGRIQESVSTKKPSQANHVALEFDRIERIDDRMDKRKEFEMLFQPLNGSGLTSGNDRPESCIIECPDAHVLERDSFDLGGRIRLGQERLRPGLACHQACGEGNKR